MLVQSRTLVQYLVQTAVILSIYQNIAAQEEDDYFYDSALSEKDIKNIQQEKELEQQRLKSLQTTIKATTPEFFAQKKSEDQKVDNWDEFYMKKMVQTYMDKYQEEQLEKRRKKFETDLNHPLLSVITLTTFFTVTSIIGLVIVYVRGKQFRKNTTKNEKNTFQPVDTNEIT